MNFHSFGIGSFFGWFPEVFVGILIGILHFCLD